MIKESFLHNKETTDPLDNPKFYVNLVFADKVLPPLNKNKEFANPKDDSTWQIIPVVFTQPKTRKNLANIECIHYDAHVNTCVIDKCKESQDRLKAIWNNIIQKFQNHIRFEYLLHKRSLKICKSKKYKHSLGNGSQKVSKFTLPKEYQKHYFLEAKAEFEAKLKERQKLTEPKEVQLIEKSNAKQKLTEINLPGGKSTADLSKEQQS